ncbi:MAG: hypothetical protein IH874_06860 [Candidatus Dadabacteria bacterium]|nr:hypothetical protein [Candidatus Dadabacteria bacterium]
MKKALIVVDHGSVFEAANNQLAEIVELLQDREHTFDIVRHAHMELASPTIADAFDACVSDGASDITVHPYFLAPGRHSTTDIPRLVTEAASKHPHVTYRITAPLGIHDKILELVIERAGK